MTGEIVDNILRAFNEVIELVGETTSDTNYYSVQSIFFFTSVIMSGGDL